jgi:hypothetical protein
MKKLNYLIPFLGMSAVTFVAQWIFGPYLVTRGLLPKDIILIMIFGILVYTFGFLVGWLTYRLKQGPKNN